ncbi:MAG TPA: heparan-alpha-glucosaminide N-acetyltransferase domain-containing protein [Gemmatimonadaceae bacterium]|nr:heparan-alpha-glucosaminide N-acetyltransferase domain-containing protein [Gemmatimonadaceae bacterium]
MTTTAGRISPFTAPATAILAPDGTVAAARIASIDVVRGLAMVLMAIDHVRVYSGLPAGGPTPGIFFTRWITHFVAPAFVFLAGTSAWLYGRRVGSRRALSRYLLTRGLVLVALELTVIRVAWTFNLDFAHYMLAGVIWMIGLCMILMAALVWLPQAAIAALGVGIILLHNTSDLLGLGEMAQSSSVPWLWQILYFGGPIGSEQGPLLAVLFVIVPWIGVMAAGYALGPVMEMSAGRRRRICLTLGMGAIAAFLALRTIDRYGDPRHWRQAPPPAGAPAAASGAPAPGAAAPRPAMPTALRFLNTSKYPASLLFLLMTLGPMLVLLALAERARGAVARTLVVFGRVPFFYYLLHIPLIHALACVVSLLRTGRIDPWLFANHPLMNPPAPAGYTWRLALLHAVWVLAVALLYFPCRWYAEWKATHRGSVVARYL